MSSVPMPRAMTEEAVAAFMREVCCLNVQRIPAAELRAWEHSSGKEGWRIVAAHVIALVESERAKERASTREKVRECIAVTEARCFIPRDGPPYYGSCSPGMTDDEIVARVMGDQPSGGHDEGRPAREEA